MAADDQGDEQEINPFPLDEQYKPFAVMISAINAANQLRDELVGKKVGMLADYVDVVTPKAALAMQGLVNVNPNDPVEIMRLQKEIAAYAHVIGWIQDTLANGASAEAEWIEMKEAEESIDG